MVLSIGDRMKRAWNAFNNQNEAYISSGRSSSRSSSSSHSTSYITEKTIITSVINKISLDVGAAIIKQVCVDSEGRYLRDYDCSINKIFNIEANIDQSGYSFKQDLITSLLTEGCVAAVPIDGELKDNENWFSSISSMRVGKIIEWYPESIKVNVYNDSTGQREDVIVKKRLAAIIENPLYAVMNAPNSTAQRLVKKLSMLDKVDELNCSGKFNMIIQVPYAIKNAFKEKVAKDRLDDLENQLTNSTFGIAYIDSTEKVIQLNRPLDNSLMNQIEYLTKMLYSHLGFTQSIIDGTADERTMLNYTNRTINPILDAVVSEFDRTYITPTARTQGQKIMYFRDPFKSMSVTAIAESADKLTRNEVMTGNEVRQKIGMKPSEDPRADQLLNKNISADKTVGTPSVDIKTNTSEEE